MQHTPRPCFPRVAALTLGLALAASGAWAQPQIAETEPNSSCAAAQDLTQAPLPLAAGGSLQTPPGTPDVDFYRLAATPGDLVRLNVDGRSVYPLTLEDPLLGVFDSSCNLITTGDDWYGPEPQVFVQVPADGVLVTAITSNYDWDFTGDGSWSGTYRLRAARAETAEAIEGRVIDGRTGQPLAGANVGLTRCAEGCLNAGGTVTDETGAFRFATGEATTEGPLLTGTYQLNVYRPNWLPYESEPFPVTEGQELDLGAIPLQPEPYVAAIRGRVVDGATGAPLSGTAEPRARVYLQSCQDEETPYCGTIVDTGVEADGTFLFAGSPESPWPRPGWFQIFASAEQYEGAVSARFYVGDGQSFDAGSLGLASFPVRLYLERSCGEIPSTGGPCRATIRVVNGLPGRLKAESWSVIQANGPDFGRTNLTTFQVAAPQPLTLAPGASLKLPLRFNVPGGVADGTTICGQTVVAPKRNPFETFGSRFLFCLTKGVEGFAPVPEAQKHDAVQKLLGRTPPPRKP